jgi:hypothetical protein
LSCKGCDAKVPSSFSTIEYYVLWQSYFLYTLCRLKKSDHLSNYSSQIQILWAHQLRLRKLNEGIAIIEGSIKHKITNEKSWGTFYHKYRIGRDSSLLRERSYIMAIQVAINFSTCHDYRSLLHSLTIFLEKSANLIILSIVWGNRIYCQQIPSSAKSLKKQISAR